MSPSPPDMADLGALAGLAPALATTFASIASDIALVIDADGVIRSVALGDAPISRQVGHWVGLPFIDTVTQGTRGKITQLLDEVDATGVSRRREVNLPGAEGLEIPVLRKPVTFEELGRKIRDILDQPGRTKGAA